ncbi:condensation domain-containing protein [Umezawaea endophytica]|uniref:Condensation domain-containing protein n=1 Tax=Umezawaea endophytica TaxID=1654476 RepID=A0A9X2VI85_9PSEU|nr:condensation domain-containing protein [Umezawaea endophytica]MCS7476854.1 condensation domain-containing protein [Umezawaea endophytica]
MTVRPTSLWQSFAWDLEALRPGFVDSPWFTMNAVVELRGPVDTGGLAVAVDRLVRRHEVLRTEVTRDGQVVRATPGTGLEVLEEGEVEDWTHAPVARDVPIRVRFATTGPDTHVLSLHLHHLVADPETLWILLADLGLLYAEQVGGPPAAGPVEQFGDYALAEAEVVRSGRDEAEAWWDRAVGRASFAGVAATGEGEAFAYRAEVLDAEEFTRVERGCLARRTTPLVTLLAAVADGMARQVPDGDTFVFTTIFGKRDRPRWRRVAGPCLVPSYLTVPRTGDHRGVLDAVRGCSAHARFPAGEIRAMNHGVSSGIVPFFEYLPSGRPAAVDFGPVRGRVTAAAGPKDTGRAQELGIRLRRTDEGALHGHFSADGVGWTREATGLLTSHLGAVVRAL